MAQAPKSSTHAKLTVVQNNTASVQAAIKMMTKRRVLVGIPSTTAPRSGGKNAAAINNAEIGYIQEFGSPAANIPPRPFLVPGINDVKAKLIKRMELAGQTALSGDLIKLDQMLHSVGIVAQNAVRARITRGPFTPLAPATIAARQRRGVTRINPLLDTGKLRQAITYVLRDM